MSVHQISVEILKDYVEKAIEKWQKNELQAQANLAAGDRILNGEDELPDPEDKDHPYNRFLNAVATDMVMSVFGEHQKTFFRQLFRYSNHWQEMIAPKQDKPATTMGSELEEGEIEDTKKAQAIEDVAIEEDAEEPLDDDEPTRSLEGKQKLFEESRDAILAELPDEAKARFGQIYFTKRYMHEHFVPVLVMNPYSVPPGTARDDWLRVFHGRKKEGRLSKILDLVYWYGSSKDTNPCYAVRTKKNLISYEIGIKRQFDQINPVLQKKIDEHAPLNATEIQLIKALKEMKDDLVKEPHERSGYVPQDFRNVWELSTEDEGNAVLGEKPTASSKNVVRASKDENDARKKTTSSSQRNVDPKVMDDPSYVPPKNPNTEKKAKSRLSSVVTSSGNQISVDILKDYVETAIEKWQKNELQAEADLAADDIILNGGDDIPDPKDKDHPYNRFLKVVAADMVSVFGENQKTFFRQLFRFSKKWQELLAPKKAKPATTKLPKKKRAPKLAKNEFDDRKKSRPAEVVDNVVEDDGKEPPRSLESKRKLFEEGRDAILAEVPDEAKARFGQIYFAKWVKQALPVLVLNPYSVPPGVTRNQWLGMFDNLKKTDRLSNITNLVYWYGSSKDPNNCCSIWTTKNLISYEIGIKQKLDQINPNLQKKIDEQSKLSATEIQLIKALKEMKDDLVKEPHERRGYIPQDFLEVWELSTDDEGYAVLGEKPIATKKKVVRTSKDESTTKKKTTSSNKRKKDAKVMDDPSDVPPKKPKTEKKSKSSQSSDVALPASLPKTSEEGQTGVLGMARAGNADEIIGDTGSALHVAAQPDFVDVAIKEEQDDYLYKVAMGLIDSDESLEEASTDPLESPGAKVMDDPSDEHPKKPKTGKKAKSSQSSVALPVSVPKTSKEGLSGVLVMPKDEIIGDNGSPPDVEVHPDFVDVAIKEEQVE